MNDDEIPSIFKELEKQLFAILQMFGFSVEPLHLEAYSTESDQTNVEPEIPTEIIEHNGSLLITIDLRSVVHDADTRPNVKFKDKLIEVHMKGHMIKSVPLPHRIDPKDAKIQYKNQILSIKVTIKKESNKPDNSKSESKEQKRVKIPIS